MGRRHSEAAHRPRRARVLLGSLPALAILAGMVVAAPAVAAPGHGAAAAAERALAGPALSAPAAAHDGHGSLTTARQTKIGRSIGVAVRVDAAAAAKAAHGRVRPGSGSVRHRLDLGAGRATHRVTPSIGVATGGSIRTTTTATTTATTATTTPRSVGQPAPVVATSFAGITQADTCSCEPPDPWIAVSPAHVVQSTNGLVRISTRTGVALMSIPTWALFAVPSDRFDTDPRIIWDAVHGRWLGVLATYTSGSAANGLELAVSDGSDPTGTWNVYDIEFGSYLPDFPGISSSSTKIVLTSNDFLDGTTYAGPTFLLIDWSNVLAGTSLFVGGISYNNTAIGGFRPAITLSTATNTPIIYEEGADPAYFEVAGTAHAPTAVANVDLVSTFGLTPFTTPDPPVQPGATTIANAVDERPTDAVFRNGVLWFVATADDFDGTNHWDAARWTRVTTAANGTSPTAAVDRFAAAPNTDVFMPGIGIDGHGSAILVATTSDGTSIDPTTVLGGFMAGGGAVPLTAIETSSVAYTGSRWGDYVGVAADPSATGSVWIGHELAANDGSWRTTVVRAVSDGTPPTAPGALAQAIVSPATLGGSVSVRTSWAAATDADSSVRGYRVEISADGGPFAGAETVGTSVTNQLLIGHSYQYRVSAVNVVGLVGPAAVGPIYRPTLYQSTTSTTYSGTWSSQTNAVYSGGSSRYSSTAGAAATFSSTLARSVAIVVTRATTRGSFKVYVDGVYKATVSSYGSPTIYRRILYQVSWSTAGTHTVKIVVAGTAGHPRVDLDAFVVLR